MLRIPGLFIVRSQDRTPMLLTHVGSVLCDGLCVWGRPGGFVGGLATAGDWPSRLLSELQIGAVTWRGLTPHLLEPREDPGWIGFLDRVSGDASRWMSVSLRSL